MLTVKIRASAIFMARPVNFNRENSVDVELEMTAQQLKFAFGELIRHGDDNQLQEWLREMAPEHAGAVTGASA